MLCVQHEREKLLVQENIIRIFGKTNNTNNPHFFHFIDNKKMTINNDNNLPLIFRFNQQFIKFIISLFSTNKIEWKVSSPEIRIKYIMSPMESQKQMTKEKKNNSFC